MQRCNINIGKNYEKIISAFRLRQLKNLQNCMQGAPAMYVYKMEIKQKALSS